MKQNTRIFIVFFLLLFLAGCIQNSNYKSVVNNSKKQDNLYLGDSEMAAENYFKLITGEKGYSILNIQNQKYMQKYSHLQKEEFSSAFSDKLKFIIENQSSKKDIKVNLFTIVDNKKVDSIPFYRYMSKDYGYTIMSYFNRETKKIIQLQYFPTNLIPRSDGRLSIGSFSEISISSNGKIIYDTIPFMDEAVLIIVDDLNLNY